MLIDKQLEYSSDQEETTIAAHASTNIVDHIKKGDAYDELRLLVQVTETVTSGGAATVQFQYQSATDAAFTSPITHLDSGAVALATLVAGYKPFGAGARTPRSKERFTRVYYTIGTAVLTAGKFQACLLRDTQIPAL